MKGSWIREAYWLDIYTVKNEIMSIKLLLFTGFGVDITIVVLMIIVGHLSIIFY